MNEKKEALRIEILKYIEKHSRVDLGELAVLLGVEETDVANEMAEMEKDFCQKKESEELNNGSQNENEDSSNDRFTESRNSGT